MASHIITSIGAALKVLEERSEHLHIREVERTTAIVMHRLRALRTFVLCSAFLRSTEKYNDSELKRSKMPKHKLSVLNALLPCSNYSDTTLESLLVKVQMVVSRFLDTCSDPDVYFIWPKLPKYIVKIESLEEEMDKWYAILSEYSQRSSSGGLPDQVWNVANSVAENVEDFLTFHRVYGGVCVESIEALKENITFLRNFIRFATLLSADQHQEFHDLLALIQPLVISAAHCTVHLFSATHYNIQVLTEEIGNSTSATSISYDGMQSMISALLLRIKAANNPLLYETYFRSLQSIKNSKELLVPILDLQEFNTFLVTTLWEMLLLDTAPVASLKDKLQALYEGLRFLATLLEKQANKFVGTIRDITGAAVFDAGVIIFSLHQKDYVIDHGLPDFLKRVQVIQSEVLGVQAVKASIFNFPTVLGFIDFLLDYLTEVRHSPADPDTPSYALKIIREELVFLRSFVDKLMELRSHQEDLHQTIWNLSVEVACKIEFLIDQLVLGNILATFSTSLKSITEDMMIIQTESKKIAYEVVGEIRIQKVTWTSTDQVSSQSDTLAGDEVVGFEVERSSVIDRLARGPKTLQVVAIAGMPGLGKTTLATKVYNDPSVRYYFHLRAWCCVSQVFNRRKVLLELLDHHKPNRNSKDDEDLSQELWRSLKGRRYLIFVDDVWDVQAFNCLKESFPDDYNGSRILLTSRQGDLVPEAIFLPQLTVDESLDLLRRKLFPAQNSWPQEIHEFARDVSKYCKGLPLTIVIVAGLLTNTRQEDWKEILKSLRSGIISTLTDECKNSIDLSYKHLPDYLKSCFLSFGAFLEDQEVGVKRLMWMWIAEGFVRKSASKSTEEIATEYLDILIGRSLVIKARERSTGGVRACRVHDLLHDFCLRKVNEEHFSHVLKEDALPLSEPSNLRRLCIHSKAEQFMDSKLFCPRLRSLLFFNSEEWWKRLDMAFIFRISKLLRVLAMDGVGLAHFPSEIGFLVQLRYLAIHVPYEVSPYIANLTNLETLILVPKVGIIRLPDSFWNLQKLRHLYMSNKSRGFLLPVNNLESSCNLVELESLSTIHINNMDILERQLRKFPNICRLKCNISNDPENGEKVLSFSFLSRLESLSLTSLNMSFTGLILPESIKRLVLDVQGLSWEYISGIAELPNLEVLKLLCVYFPGNTWHVEEGQFSELKILVLKSLFIVKWTTASYDQFPNLEKLVLKGCVYLEETPECLENAANLRLIEVLGCPEHVAGLVRKVEECQKDMGNSVLQVHVRDVYVEVSDYEDEISWWRSLCRGTTGLWKRLLQR